jgi:hypothetical protein
MMRLLTSLALTVLLWVPAACLPEYRDPCSDQDCSGHGECDLVQEGDGWAPVCICDDGYMLSPDGLNCYRPDDRSGSGSQPDGGVDC